MLTRVYTSLEIMFPNVSCWYLALLFYSKCQAAWSKPFSKNVFLLIVKLLVGSITLVWKWIIKNDFFPLKFNANHHCKLSFFPSYHRPVPSGVERTNVGSILTAAVGLVSLHRPLSISRRNLTDISIRSPCDNWKRCRYLSTYSQMENVRQKYNPHRCAH